MPQQCPFIIFLVTQQFCQDSHSLTHIDLFYPIMFYILLIKKKDLLYSHSLKVRTYRRVCHHTHTSSPGCPVFLPRSNRHYQLLVYPFRNTVYTNKVMFTYFPTLSFLQKCYILFTHCSLYRIKLYPVFCCHKQYFCTSLSVHICENLFRMDTQNQSTSLK